MRRRVVLSSLVLALAAPSAARAASPYAAEKAPPDRTPVHVDFDMAALNFGLAVAGHVDGPFYLGVGASGLPAIGATSFSNYPLVLFEAHAFARWAPITQLHVDVGPTIAHFEEWQLCLRLGGGGCGPAPASEIVGGFVDVRAGWRHVRLGPRFMYGARRDTGETGAMFLPLFVQLEVTPRP